MDPRGPKLDWVTSLEAIYADLEKRRAERDCRLRTDCCRFRLTGEIPMLTRAEALRAAQGVRASGRKHIKERADGACPLLDAAGRCTIYAFRPFGCRTHFCAPAGGVLPRKSVADLIQRLDQLDESLGGTGPRPLPAAVTDALDQLAGRRRP